MKQAIDQEPNRTSIGNTTFADAIFGTDVRAAVNFSCRATVEDTVTTNAAINIGFTDLVNNVSLSSASEDGSVTPATRSLPSNTGFVNQVGINGSLRSQGLFNSVTPGGIIVNYPTSFSPAAELQNMGLLGDTDNEYSAVTALFTGTPNNDQDVPHNLGGTPDWIWPLGTRQTVFGTSQSGYMYSAGFWTAAGSVGLGIQQQQGIAPTNVGAIIRSGFAGNFIGPTPAVTNTVSITSVGPTSFRVSTGGGGNNGAIVFLCGRGTFAPMAVQSGLFTTRTTNGTSTFSGMTSPPTVIFRFLTRLTSNTLASDDTAGGLSFSMTVNNNGVVQQKAVACTMKDVASPSVAKSLASSKSILSLNSTTGAADITGTTAFTSDGWIDTYNLTNGVAQYGMYLAFGVSPSTDAVPFIRRTVIVDDTPIFQP